MVNISEVVINPVKKELPKMLIGSNQMVSTRSCPLVLGKRKQ